MWNNRICVRVDWYTRFCLTAIAVLLTVMILGLWAQAVPGASAARAGDAATFLDNSRSQQLAAMVKAQEQTVDKLDEIVKLLKSGEVKVQVAQEEKAEKVDHARPAKTK